MKKIILITLSFINLLSISCSNDGDNLFQGNWNGNFQGVLGSEHIDADWNGKIDSNGKLTATVIVDPSRSEKNFELSGTVTNDGNLTGTMKNTSYYNVSIYVVGKFQNNSGYANCGNFGSSYFGGLEGTKH